ncbi:Hypothetical protein GQ85_041 [Rhodococcus rhodochrous]|nr:hypothetical protein [Rhodococcus rhodochrous]OOL33143.1 Hypothetical protein GQ85_041 [Rhodococcus rhodochrous]
MTADLESLDATLTTVEKVLDLEAPCDALPGLGTGVGESALADGGDHSGDTKYADDQRDPGLCWHGLASFLLWGGSMRMISGVTTRPRSRGCAVPRGCFAVGGYVLGRSRGTTQLKTSAQLLR